MRRALFFLFLTFPTFGQTLIPRVAPDEAEKPLVKRIPPVYPPLAQQTRISGVVLFEITVDESGAPSIRRTIYGHPLLQYAAMDSVRHWKYQPFEQDGKPAKVITFVMVPFAATWAQEDQGRNEMLFRHNFWGAEEFAEDALKRGDEAESSQQLSRASAILSSGGRLGHDNEQAQWMTDMAELSAAQKKQDDAAEFYKMALKVHEDDDKESIGTAAALANLSHFYFVEKKYDLARGHANKSVSIFKKQSRLSVLASPMHSRPGELISPDCRGCFHK